MSGWFLRQPFNALNISYIDPDFEHGGPVYTYENSYKTRDGHVFFERDIDTNTKYKIKVKTAEEYFWMTDLTYEGKLLTTDSLEIYKDNSEIEMTDVEKLETLECIKVFAIDVNKTYILIKEKSTGNYYSDLDIDWNISINKDRDIFKTDANNNILGLKPEEIGKHEAIYVPYLGTTPMQNDPYIVLSSTDLVGVKYLRLPHNCGYIPTDTNFKWSQLEVLITYYKNANSPGSLLNDGTSMYNAKHLIFEGLSQSNQQFTQPFIFENLSGYYHQLYNQKNSFMFGRLTNSSQAIEQAKKITTKFVVSDSSVVSKTEKIYVDTMISEFLNIGGRYKEIHFMTITEDEASQLSNFMQFYNNCMSSGCKVYFHNKNLTEPKNWEYTLDDETNTINLTKYVGTEDNITVHNKYLVNDKIYDNVICRKQSLPLMLNLDEMTDEQINEIKVQSSPFFNVTSKEIDFENNVKLDEDCYGFFANSTFELGLKGVDTSETIDMDNMFKDSQSKILDLTTFDTRKNKRMTSMFMRSQATEIKGIENFTTDTLTTLMDTFYGSKVKNLDLSKWNTSRVSIMQRTFKDCEFESLNLSNWDVRNVTTMVDMFSNCKIDTLDLSSFDLSNIDVSKMIRFVNGCTATTGYARTQADADKINASSGKPSTLTFIVKPQMMSLDETLNDEIKPVAKSSRKSKK